MSLMKLLGAIFIVVFSFFVTLKILDNYGGRVASGPPSPIPDVAFNAAALPRLSPGQSLDFASGGNRGALISGWSEAEPGGVWSEGHSAIIGFIANNAGPAGRVVVHVDPYVVPGKLDVQKVEVWFRKQKIADFAISSGPGDLEIQLPGPLQPGEPVTLGLYLPNANSPKAVVGTPDTRIVAIRLKSLELAGG